jgi:hypothetical protein
LFLPVSRASRVPDGAFMDVVIPNYFDLDDITVNFEPDDDDFYRRPIMRKGIQIALDAAAPAGVKLLLCAQRADRRQAGR